ncbi:FAD-dependent oxidoreductase [bacterium]|nr:FAD-dependent oxidoreductase [bacterium]
MTTSRDNSETALKVIVVGGGIIGLATAAELSERGYAVALFEQGRIHEATSGNSHRIIHGGLRYLQQFQIGRVLRSLEAKHLAASQYPEEIVPLPCYLPVTGRGLQRGAILGVAGALYGMLSTLAGYPTEWSAIRSNEVVRELSPYFSHLPYRKAFQWHDARLKDPSALAKKLRDRVIAGGGEVKEGVRVEEVAPASEPSARSQWVRTTAGEFFADAVVLALGPQHGTVRLSPKRKEGRPQMWAKAFNLVLREELVRDVGVGIPTARGAALFCAPRSSGHDGPCSAVGTWYVPVPDQTVELVVTEEEQGKALREVSESLALPEPLSSDLVCGVEVGLLPAKGVRDGEPELMASEEIRAHDGVWSILSTKYTVFPVIAREIADAVGQYLSSER